jgi:hypothetical protein
MAFEEAHDGDDGNDDDDDDDNALLPRTLQHVISNDLLTNAHLIKEI